MKDPTLEERQEIELESGSGGDAAGADQPPVKPTPDKGKRPRAYDRLDIKKDKRRVARFQWRFGLIPTHIKVEGEHLCNPFRDRAIFVVHGMGEQLNTETAATLRTGVETAVLEIDPRHWMRPENGRGNDWIVPVPFVFDGHWGHYGDLEKTHPDLWKTLHEREHKFFRTVWRRRLDSPWRTTRWAARTGARLVRRSRGWAFIYYWMLVPLLWVAIALLNVWPRTKRILSHTLSDVRNYLDPEGDTAHSIIATIDYEVGRKFLKVLGLDWNLHDLRPSEMIQINSKPHRFDRVTWVSHSLGSVISYNVLGDILARCKQKRKEDANHPGAKRVEEALQGFVTLGSPLDKVEFLFPGNVLRDWPACYLRGSGECAADGRPLDLWIGREKFSSDDRTVGREFWANFFYTADPVSGSLDADRFSVMLKDDAGTGERRTSLVENFHTRGLRIPGFSHLSYWSDNEVLKQVLTRVFEPPLVDNAEPRLRTVSRQLIAMKAISLGWLLLLVGALGGVGWYVYTKVLSYFQ